MPFIEALGQFSHRVGKKWDLCFKFLTHERIYVAQNHQCYCYLFRSWKFLLDTCQLGTCSKCSWRAGIICLLGISFSVFFIIKFLCINVDCHIEQKTKPTQHSVRGLRSLGLSPDILACRSTTVFSPSLSLSLPSLGNTNFYLPSVSSIKNLPCFVGTWWNHQREALSFLPCPGTVTIAIFMFVQLTC